MQIEADLQIQETMDFVLIFAQILSKKDQEYIEINSDNFLQLSEEKKIIIDLDAFQSRHSKQSIELSWNQFPTQMYSFDFEGKLVVGAIKLGPNQSEATEKDSATYSIKITVDQQLKKCPSDCFLSQNHGYCQQGHCICNPNHFGKFCETSAIKIQENNNIVTSIAANSIKFFNLKITQQQFSLEKPIVFTFASLELFASDEADEKKKKDQHSLLLGNSIVNYTGSEYPGFYFSKQYEKIQISSDTDNKGKNLYQIENIKALQDSNTNEIIVGIYNNNRETEKIQFYYQFTNLYKSTDDDSISDTLGLWVMLISMMVLVSLLGFICLCAKIQSTSDKNQTQEILKLQQQRERDRSQRRDLENQRIQLQQQELQQQKKKVKSIPKKLTQDIINEIFPIQTIKEIKEELAQDYPECEFDINECAVCLMEFEEQEQCRMTICLHVYHSECLESWLKKNENCPFCRFCLNRVALQKYLFEQRSDDEQQQNVNSKTPNQYEFENREDQNSVEENKNQIEGVSQNNKQQQQNVFKNKLFQQKKKITSITCIETVHSNRGGTGGDNNNNEDDSNIQYQNASLQTPSLKINQFKEQLLSHENVVENSQKPYNTQLYLEKLNYMQSENSIDTGSSGEKKKKFNFSPSRRGSSGLSTNSTTMALMSELQLQSLTNIGQDQRKKSSLTDKQMDTECKLLSQNQIGSMNDLVAGGNAVNNGTQKKQEYRKPSIVIQEMPDGENSDMSGNMQSTKRKRQYRQNQQKRDFNNNNNNDCGIEIQQVEFTQESNEADKNVIVSLQNITDSSPPELQQ